MLLYLKNNIVAFLELEV